MLVDDIEEGVESDSDDEEKYHDALVLEVDVVSELIT